MRRVVLLLHLLSNRHPREYLLNRFQISKVQRTACLMKLWIILRKPKILYDGSKIDTLKEIISVKE